MSWPRKADFCLQFGVHAGAGPADLSQMVQQVAKVFNKARGVNLPAQPESAPRADQAWFQLETFSGWLVLVREQVEAAGYDFVIFHANGVGGAAMEQLIQAGIPASRMQATAIEPTGSSSVSFMLGQPAY